MAGITSLGYPLHMVARYVQSAPTQFTANTTVTVLVGGIPPSAEFRLNRAFVICSAVPADADGTMLVNVIAKDDSEGADDSLVASADLEALVTVANKVYELTLATETSEKERILANPDGLRVTLVNNSVAIDTNAQVVVMLELVPLPNPSDSLVKYKSSY